MKRNIANATTNRWSNLTRKVRGDPGSRTKRTAASKVICALLLATSMTFTTGVYAHGGGGGGGGHGGGGGGAAFGGGGGHGGGGGYGGGRGGGYGGGRGYGGHGYGRAFYAPRYDRYYGGYGYGGEPYYIGGAYDDDDGIDFGGYRHRGYYGGHHYSHDFRGGQRRSVRGGGSGGRR